MQTARDVHNNGGEYEDIVTTTQDGDTRSDYSELSVKQDGSKEDDYSKPMSGQCDSDGCNYVELV